MEQISTKCIRMIPLRMCVCVCVCAERQQCVIPCLDGVTTRCSARWLRSGMTSHQVGQYMAACGFADYEHLFKESGDSLACRTVAPAPTVPVLMVVLGGLATSSCWWWLPKLWTPRVPKCPSCSCRDPNGGHEEHNISGDRLLQLTSQDLRDIGQLGGCPGGAELTTSRLKW